MSATSGKTIPTPGDFERQLADFINATLLGGGSAVGRDSRLFEEGYINSLRILDLIALVEKTLGQRIPDRAVRLANFRTIATIVRAFHPGAAAAQTTVPTATDRLFEHRTPRARFASPIESLGERGDLALTSAGQVALSGIALDVLRAIDHTAVQWAASLGATERSYPSLIDLAILERAGQVESFPQHLTVVGHPAHAPDHSAPQPSEVARAAAADRVARHALSPAVCYHVYPEWEGRTLDESPTVLTARNRCYRYEGGTHVPLERLWEFSMREIVVLGTRDQVETMRQGLVRQVGELVTTLGLDGAIDLASDPFFTAGDEGRRLMQQAGALKYELQLTVDTTGRSVAAASFNHHHEFFGQRFSIRRADGEAAESGCVAFGLERWVLAVLAQHGVNEGDWPAGARAWLHEGRSPSRTGASVAGRGGGGA